MTNLTNSIQNIKKALGDSVCIVGHHYQAEDVIMHCDIAGDSLELARKVAAITAPHIIFCGVHFMAEAAALLAREGQKVYIPDLKANCVMAQMTPAPLLEKVLSKLDAHAKTKGKKIIPLAYVNTSLAVKDVVGRFGGSVCTSANADIMLKWALNAGDQVLFLPDKNLARNTAKDLGLDASLWHTVNIRKNGTCIDFEAADKARLLLWPGCCAIHAKFYPEHITAMREKYKDCRIALHPESNPKVVELADGAGSTSYLINYVANSPKGSTIIIGTESNLVYRLRDRFADHCNVIPLREVYCSDMAKITEEKLLRCLQDISSNEGSCDTQVHILPSQTAAARSSLERMLKACAEAGV